MQPGAGTLSGAATLVDFVDLLNNPTLGAFLPTSDSFSHSKSSSNTSNATASSSKLGAKPPLKGPHAGSRARTGCLTCRLRKKRCDEAKPSCQTCERLGIECMGYGKKRPDWLKDDNNVKRMRDQIREKVLAKRAQRPKKRPRSNSEGSQGTGSPEPDVGDDDGDGDEDMNITSTTEPPDLSNIDLSTAWQNQAPFQPAQFHDMSQDQLFPPVSEAPFQRQTAQIWELDSVRDFNPAASLTLGGEAQQTPSTGTSNTFVISPTAQVATTRPAGGTPPFGDPDLDEMWKTLFGNAVPFTTPPSAPTPLVLSPSPYPPLPEQNIFNFPTPTPDLNYLHHYLNVVMPLQFRTARSMAIGELVVPLAFQRAEVLTSISSLAALHLASKRTGLLLTRNPRSPSDSLFPTDVASDNDALVARAAHRDSIERLRFVNSDHLEAEDVIFPAVFAVSYLLFMGGTSTQWRELIAMCQKCLAAAINASPDLTGEYVHFNASDSQKKTPWQRYRPLIEVLISTDIVGSLSQNRGSRMLPTYRTLLGRINGFAPPEQTISMLDVMGCDNTTLLAIAETTALSEWRDRAEETGTLSQRTLVKRAESIEKLLGERNWRNSHSNELTDAIENMDGEARGIPDEWTKTHLMADVFFAAAKVYLATVVNGPFPKVPELAEAVQSSMDALRRIGRRYPRPDIFRKLVFPITITGCHSDTEEQREFFRECFSKLGPEAAFGNTRSALALMEEVWRKRALYHPQVKVCWRQTMVELGWEAGLLMI